MGSGATKQATSKQAVSFSSNARQAQPVARAAYPQAIAPSQPPPPTLSVSWIVCCVCCFSRRFRKFTRRCSDSLLVSFHLVFVCILLAYSSVIVDCRIAVCLMRYVVSSRSAFLARLGFSSQILLDIVNFVAVLMEIYRFILAKPCLPYYLDVMTASMYLILTEIQMFTLVKSFDRTTDKVSSFFINLHILVLNHLRSNLTHSQLKINV